jgi:hypothetical protein
MVKIDAEHSLVIKRESIEELIGRPFDLQELQMSLITISGHLDEDDDEFRLSWAELTNSGDKHGHANEQEKAGPQGKVRPHDTRPGLGNQLSADGQGLPAGEV